MRESARGVKKGVEADVKVMYVMHSDITARRLLGCIKYGTFAYTTLRD